MAGSMEKLSVGKVVEFPWRVGLGSEVTIRAIICAAHTDPTGTYIMLKQRGEIAHWVGRVIDPSQGAFKIVSHPRYD